MFNETLGCVRDSLAGSNSAMEQYCSKAFAGSSGGVRAKLRSVMHRVTQATALSDKMTSVEAQVKDASSQLLHLISMLSSALKTQEQQDIMVPKLDRLSITAVGEPVYRPETTAPALPHTVSLSFDARDPNGSPITPEGTLKHSVLSNVSSAAVSAAAGVLKPAFGIVGMAGVGKTIALQGLAFDEDIRKRFPDGVQYMTLGQGATVKSAVREIVKILRITGATEIANVVESASLLSEAVDYAVTWFRGKVCLFLVDDVWPTRMCKTGYLSDLRQLLRGSPESRMAISTRSVAIAHSAGLVVDFGARDPLGPVSQKLFLAHATSSIDQNSSENGVGELRESFRKILSACAGLPIALAVAGCAIALLMRIHGDFESACDAYCIGLEEGGMCFGDEESSEGTSLSVGILLSLKYLQVDFLKWKAKNAPEAASTIDDLYISLCVLANQEWIPISVLSRMWKLDKKCTLDVANMLCGMSLAQLQLRKSMNGSRREVGLILHDLHLDFCRRKAEERNCRALWHSQLLNGYLESPPSTRTSLASGEPSDLVAKKMLSLSPRPWWSKAVPEDGYIHSNLARHLASASLGIELGALLLDARWTHLRDQIGGILELKTDFEWLSRHLVSLDVNSKQVTLSFDLILRAIRLSWGRISDGRRAFLFQLCGRLLGVRNDNEIVDAFLKSIEAQTERPYLVPVSSFLPGMWNAQMQDIPVRGWCRCVASSPCNLYIAAGAGHDVVIADAVTGDILRRLKGHRDFVKSISFYAGSEKVLSGSYDETIMLWAWETSDTPVQVLEGHSDRVMDIAVSSNTTQLFSVSLDCTLRVWDLIAGSQSGDFVQPSCAMSVAVCDKIQVAAFGLENGTLKVLDISRMATIFEDVNEHEKPIGSITFSPNGECMATGSWDGNIRLWNTRTWDRIRECCCEEEDYINSVGFSPNGLQLVSGSDDGTIRVWDAAATGIIARSPQLHSWVSSVIFTHDGKRIVTGSRDGIVRVWDAVLLTESPEESCAGLPILGVALSQDGLRVASGSEDGTVCLWDSQSGLQLGVPLRGHSYDVNCVSWSPDGTQVVSGSDDKTIRLWDTETFSAVGDALEAHSGAVFCVSVSFDGLRFVSGSWDEAIRIWGAKTREPLGDALEGHQRPVSSVAESRDGCHIVSRDGNNVTFIWSRKRRTIIWKSDDLEKGSANEITDEKAEIIIRSCGQETPQLWPESFPSYISELYCEKECVYSYADGEKYFLGTLPSSVGDWKYDSRTKVLAAGLDSGAVAICSLVAE